MAPQKWRPADLAGRRRVARHLPENWHSLRVTVRSAGSTSEGFARLAANRCIQELNRVHDGSPLAMACQCGLHLQQTSRIPSCHHVSLQWCDELRLSVPQLLSGVGLNEVEDSRGAAADGGFGNFGKLQPGNARK